MHLIHEIISYVLGGIVLAIIIIAASLGWFGGTGLEWIVDWLARATGLQAKTGVAGESVTGIEGILGQTAEVVDLVPAKNAVRVSLRGETWTAISKDANYSFNKGDKVQVVSMDGLTLTVVAAKNSG